MTMADDGEVSLRPVTLRPGGAAGNPFASFGKGAGFGIKAKQASSSAAAADDVPKKTGPRIKYSKEFLMMFLDRYTKCPIEVQQSGLDIVVSEEEGDQQRQVLAKVAEEIDDRDWRTRDKAPAPAAFKEPRPARDGPAPQQQQAAAAAPAPQQQQAAAPAKQAEPQQAAVPAPQQAAAPQAAAPQGDGKIVRAADIGLQAYRPGASMTAEERALRSIKGILNKLTPEKFDRLLSQLLEVITTAEILKHTITLVFENAVEQPTYCAMYADLCFNLSKELPSFPPPAGSDKPITFAQILLNTCQDEFEGTEQQREEMLRLPSGPERDERERHNKKRVMGNMRLISELYKKEMVKDWIMTTCVEELLMPRPTGGKGSKPAPPSEENIEAACEMITTAGARLSQSKGPGTTKKLDDVFKMLAKLAEERGLSSRVRFVIKDVIELRKMNWVPRREVFTAKKLEEVRAQAEAELGMISSNIAANLPTLALPSQQRLGGGAGGAAGDDFLLIPPLRGGEGDGWAFSSSASSGGAAKGAKPAGSSALLGDWVEPAARVVAPAAAPAPVPAAATPAPPPTSDGLSDEDLHRKCEGLFQEYCSTLDKTEACTCVQELGGSARAQVKVLEVGVDQILNSTRDKDQGSLSDLLVHLHAQGLLSTDNVAAGLSTFTVQLEDLKLDYPKAPAQLGHLVGSLVASGALTLETVATLLEGDSGAEAKRGMAGPCLKLLKEKFGEEKLGEACKAAGFVAGKLLEADPALDGDLPSVEAFLKEEGLSVVPL